MNNYFNMNKISFFFLMMISTIFSISSLSMINIWMGMEVNLISFIPLMVNNKNNFSSESMISYFLAQSLGSANFLFSSMLMISLNKWFMINSKINLTILFMMNISLFMKMGAAPFHFWFPKTMKGLNWMNCLILSTWQKILPMIALSYCFIYKITLMIATISTITGALMGLNQPSLQMIMSYSSINHIGWMIISLMIKINIWTMYMLIYSLMNAILMFMFKSMNMYKLNQIYSNKSFNLINYFLMFNLLSLSGLPPFLGFFPKWMVINLMIENNLHLINLIMIFMSLINMYIYIRIIYSYLLMNFLEIKFYKIQFNYFKFMTLITIFSMMGLLFTPLINMLIF
uniref:NADH dehydrogenase subunit 2 n=1 Tax=Apatidelia acuminata TaxID=1842858 RepID=UPI0022DCDFB4|nr:NADH dehydrogenase subunit 2 [Apatidelia acuminata]UZZ43766.1 NADH dehydrogenase subunit 2 [Apatidelia acuminata]